MDATTQAQGGAARLIQKVKQETRRKFSAEDKIRIVLEGFRKEISVAELCRRERINPTVYYNWLKQFMEGGKCQLRGDTLRSATREEVSSLREENLRLKELRRRAGGYRLLHRRDSGLGRGRRRVYQVARRRKKGRMAVQGR
ncbi:transposase [bacterium]|nr:transposase [bacterium]